MTTSCRPWWRNCAIDADPEICAIDRMEDRITPVSPEATGIRELISTLELCHHKAERWVHNIVEAIGAGETRKRLGTRAPGPPHPAEQVWQQACGALSDWCAGCPGPRVDRSIGPLPAARLLAGIGERTPLKEWQVQRVIDKVRSWIHFPQSCDDPTAQYVSLLLNGDGYESAYRDGCPEQYEEHHDFWQSTVQTRIHDTVDSRPAEVSLALAIDMLWPCHWRFMGNLQLVLDAIGGVLEPEEPFAACGRNIMLLPLRDQMTGVCNTLRAFCDSAESEEEVDRLMLAELGEPTPVKQWLAASLEKTLRLQLDPPAEVRAMSALEGPVLVSPERPCSTPGDDRCEPPRATYAGESEHEHAE